MTPLNITENVWLFSIFCLDEQVMHLGRWHLVQKKLMVQEIMPQDPVISSLAFWTIIQDKSGSLRHV